MEETDTLKQRYTTHKLEQTHIPMAGYWEGLHHSEPKLKMSIVHEILLENALLLSILPNYILFFTVNEATAALNLF